jgi:hypothetical protein
MESIDLKDPYQPPHHSLLMMMMMMMTFTYIKITTRGCHKNLYSIRFHTDQPKRHKYKKISMIIRNKGSINDNEAETIPEASLNSGAVSMDPAPDILPDDDDVYLIKLQERCYKI